MKNRIFFILVLVLFCPFYSKVSASELCSPKGYSVFTINGIFNNKVDAIKNKDKLKSKFGTTLNNEPLVFDYLYNSTHLAGVGDIFDAVEQGLFDQKSDYDLVEMLNDASQKISTQKILLVAHSQGNFYANNFYDKVASQPGGVPSQSIGVYGVASPANRVSGGGKYLTSDTDNVIASVVARFIKILPPNIHIPLSAEIDGSGHDFSDVYLKYQGERIVSDIKSSLDKLKTNDEQELGEPCISPPELTLFHKMEGVVIKSADLAINSAKEVVSYTVNGLYNTGAAIASTTKKISNAIISVVSSLVQSLKSNNDLAINNGAAAIEAIEERPQDIPQKSNLTLAGENPNTTEIIDQFSPIPAPDVSKDTANNISSSVIIPVVYRGGGGGGSPILNPEPALEDETPSEEDPIIPIVTEDPITPIVIDEIAPVVSIIGENPLDIIKDTVYVDVGATALDDIDGVVDVIVAGTVDDSIEGTYVITYTATDVSGNTGTATRVVNVVNPPVVPLPLPTPDTTPPIITVAGNSLEVIIKNSSYVDAGATAVDDVDGSVIVDVTGFVNISVLGIYTITYTATDAAGNIATASRDVRVSSRIYIPKYKFGTENGDGNDWQVWSFNGSNIYNWSDAYVGSYLHEHFILNRYGFNTYMCSNCAVIGVFAKNPLLGFEPSDILKVKGIENNQQNSLNADYQVDYQWDALGYTYTISHDSIIDATGHIDIPGANADMWVGWSVNYNQFVDFPAGSWTGHASRFPGGYENGLTGGQNMILQPYPIYDPTQISSEPDPIPIPDPTPDPMPDPIPEPEPIPDPVPDVTSPSITSYTFNGIADSITINPLINSISLNFISDENVNWMSIKIEKEDDASVYKTFQSGNGCVDGTDTCAKIWDGILSGGGLLQDGVYKIKLHIKDEADNEYYDYLSPYTITVLQ